MSEDLAPYKEMLAGLDNKQKQNLENLLRQQMNSAWWPDHRNIPQMAAYESKADLLLFGGAAGGGKTDLLLGLTLTKHERSVLFRAQYTDLKGIEDRLLQIANKGGREGYNGQDMVLRKDGRLIELGAIGGPGQELAWMGRAHDFIGFDEGAQLSVEKVRFVMAWLRSTTPGQRKRAVIASNPPIGGEGEWLIEWFAPWLDPMFENPAKPGELRWAIINSDGKTEWVSGPDVVNRNGEEYTPLSRTFIPSRLDDNPYLKDSGYRAQVQALPEPLRSKLLKGDFLAGRSDHAWQVIPTDWVRKAQARWKPMPPEQVPMTVCSIDVSGGGTNDPHAMAGLYGNWFAMPHIVQGVDAKDGPSLAGQIIVFRRHGALVVIDMTGGWGGSARDHLAAQNIPVESAVYNTKSYESTKDHKFKFANLRAEMWWQFREALDPASGEDIALPPDERLVAELTAPRWRPRADAILIEDKADVRSRLGSSTDRADSFVMAWKFRRQAMRSALNEGQFTEAAEPDDPLADW